MTWISIRHPKSLLPKSGKPPGKAKLIKFGLRRREPNARSPRTLEESRAESTFRFRSEISTPISLASPPSSPFRHAAVAPQRPLRRRAAPPAPLRRRRLRRFRGSGARGGGSAGGARPHLLPVLLPSRHPRGYDQGKPLRLCSHPQLRTLNPS